MIDPKQLRIGNYILVEAHPIWPRPHCVQAKDIYDIASGKVTLACVEPIPLTPELLERCGFESHVNDINLGDSGYSPKTFYYISEGVDGYGQRKIKHGFQMGTYRLKPDDLYYQNEGRRTKGRHIQYVHQLQNLFHALTGQELTINP